MSVNIQFKQELDAISSLDIPADQAVATIRKLLRNPDRDAAAAVYEAMRSASWRLLTSRTFGDEIENWFDLFSQTSALLRANNFDDFSERITTLADLAMESARFGSLHSHEQAIAKQHVLEVLRAIGENGARKIEVMNSTGLRQANLSRILANLAAIGLIERKSIGKEALFSLTRAGRDALFPKDVRPHGGSGLIVRPGVV